MLVDSKYKIFTYVGNQFDLEQLYPEEKNQIKYIQTTSSTGLSILTWKPSGESNLKKLENCKTYLLVSNSNNPNYYIDFTANQTPSNGRFFKISQPSNQFIAQSATDFLTIHIRDPNIIYLASQVVLNNYQNVWLIGNVFIGQKNYNSFRNFYIDSDTIRIVQSQNPPNLNSDLSVIEIEEKLASGLIQEGAEVCFSFSDFAEEMKIKGLSACFAPLSWETYIGIDPETGEYVQFGVCSGDCPNGRVSDNDYCEKCNEDSIFVQSLSDWEMEYESIVQNAQQQANNLVVNGSQLIEQNKYKDLDLDDQITIMDQIMDFVVSNLIEPFPTPTPALTPLPTSTL